MLRDFDCSGNSNIMDQSLFELSQEELNSHLGIIREVIRKKTKRGRKSKTELPKEPKCDICLEFFQYTSSEDRSKCTMCKAEFHASCYKTPLSPEAEFTCERCLKAKEEHKDLESYKCFICGRCDGVLYEQTLKGEFYHKVCVQFIPELRIEEDDESQVTRSNIRRWRYKNSCKYCREKLTKTKAVIKCANPKCKCFYHIPCAIQKGMIFSTAYQSHFYKVNKDYDAIPFYCCGHNKKLATSYRNDIIYQRKASLSYSKVEHLSKETTDDNSDDTSINYDALSYVSSNALNIDFDELIESNATDIRDDDNTIDFNNVSPKDRIPFDFNYSDVISDQYDH